MEKRIIELLIKRTSWDPFGPCVRTLGVSLVIGSKIVLFKGIEIHQTFDENLFIIIDSKGKVRIFLTALSFLRPGAN